MSRSRKKGFDTFCNGRNDKYCRKYYHHAKRRKIKRLLREENFENILNGKDYSLKYADRWAWASDGGAFFQEDLSSLRKEFDKEVFGNDCSRFKTGGNVWEKYLRYVELASSSEGKFGNWDLFDFLFNSHLIPLDFKKEEELASWLLENEERILRVWFSRRFPK